MNVKSYVDANGTLDWWSGTSMAAPAVAGLLLMTEYDQTNGLKKDSNGDPIMGIQAGELAFGNDSMPGPYGIPLLFQL